MIKRLKKLVGSLLGVNKKSARRSITMCCEGEKGENKNRRKTALIIHMRISFPEENNPL